MRYSDSESLSEMGFMANHRILAFAGIDSSDSFNSHYPGFICKIVWENVCEFSEGALGAESAPPTD
jgi:hypothetical protein